MGTEMPKTPIGIGVTPNTLWSVCVASAQKSRNLNPLLCGAVTTVVSASGVRVWRFGPLGVTSMVGPIPIKSQPRVTQRPAGRPNGEWKLVPCHPDLVFWELSGQRDETIRIAVSSMDGIGHHVLCRASPDRFPHPTSLCFELRDDEFTPTGDGDDVSDCSLDHEITTELGLSEEHFAERSGETVSSLTTEEDLSQAIQKCKDMIMDAPESSQRRHTLVKKLVELRFKLQVSAGYELSICPERGLSRQKFRCAECKISIAHAQRRLCDYTGLYYCLNCHWGDTDVIPARFIVFIHKQLYVCYCFNMSVETFKKPLPRVPFKRRRQQTVLEEEKYVQHLTQIIERDFFPDLESLRLKSAYLEAVKTNDLTALRALYSKFTGGKAPPTECPSASLNSYLASHTSEDNEGFEQLMEEGRERMKRKCSWAYDFIEAHPENNTDLLALPSIEVQADQSKRPNRIMMWPFKGNQALLGPAPEGLGPDEGGNSSSLPTIQHSNTRLDKQVFDMARNQAAVQEAAASREKQCVGRIGVDGKEHLTQIIERDFFPDLESLRLKSAYLEAVKTNDLTALRALYSKFTGGKAPPTAPSASPATFETPERPDNEPEVILPGSCTGNKTGTENEKPPEDDSKCPSASLNSYLASHTSEDNEGFEQLMEESRERMKRKCSWAYDFIEAHPENNTDLLALPSIEVQADQSKRPNRIMMWPFKGNQALLGPAPEGLGPDEGGNSSSLPTIQHSNTRLDKQVFDMARNQAAVQEAAASREKQCVGRIGVDGKEVNARVENEAAEEKFSMVRTPELTPSRLESPLMTWGEMEGTPFLLDGSPLRTPTPGPAFRLPETSKRDQLALALAEKVSAQHRDKKRKAMDAARSSLTSPAPSPLRRRPSSALATPGMSPSALRLARSAGLRIGPDASPLLRSSVGGGATPKTPRTPKTPLLKQKSDTTSGVSVGTSNSSLTDNLLNLPSRSKRAKAADFF
ncbi:unnamed protein product [Cyprideis torosa]|uniref:Rubicon Homology domain-containing protein n=1 Tax=Cyprideis torosa TaxID=163714 RepID=A0A7R8WAX3_9CRUS|nr:unnamed protein product [Cyprideis torosa]CAG0886776.1 unnamed protein product [Cyprideis torosa]